MGGLFVFGSLGIARSSIGRRQINRATIGEGTIIIRSDPNAGLEGLNRDLARAQEITKDSETAVSVYIDPSAMREVVSGFAGIRDQADNYETFLTLLSKGVSDETKLGGISVVDYSQAYLDAYRILKARGKTSQEAEKALNDPSFQEMVTTGLKLSQLPDDASPEEIRKVMGERSYVLRFKENAIVADPINAGTVVDPMANYIANMAVFLEKNVWVLDASAVAVDLLMAGGGKKAVLHVLKGMAGDYVVEKSVSYIVNKSKEYLINKCGYNEETVSFLADGVEILALLVISPDDLADKGKSAAKSFVKKSSEALGRAAVEAIKSGKTTDMAICWLAVAGKLALESGKKLKSDDLIAIAKNISAPGGATMKQIADACGQATGAAYKAAKGTISDLDVALKSGPIPLSMTHGKDGHVVLVTGKKADGSYSIFDSSNKDVTSLSQSDLIALNNGKTDFEFAKPTGQKAGGSLASGTGNNGPPASSGNTGGGNYSGNTPSGGGSSNGGNGGKIEKPTGTQNTPREPSGYEYWDKKVEFGGKKVYQRDDLIDLELVDGNGRTSLQRMQAGVPPLGRDGNPINLHHINQNDQGALVEVEQAIHQKNSRQLHINSGSGIPSGIDRVKFARFKKQYWKNRAKDLLK